MSGLLLSVSVSTSIINRLSSGFTYSVVIFCEDYDNTHTKILPWKFLPNREMKGGIKYSKRTVLIMCKLSNALGTGQDRVGKGMAEGRHDHAYPSPSPCLHAECCRVS